MRKKNKTHHYKDGNGLNRNPGGGAVVGCGKPEVDPPAGGVLLGNVPLAPAAHQAFTPRELAARLRRYEKRAAKRLPLFRRGRAVKESSKYPQCWACGRHSESTWPAKSDGWSTRECRVGATNAVECYCVTCMDRWGWPSEYPLYAGLRGR